MTDWLAFRAGIGADFSTSTEIEGYQMGDLDFDGDNDVEDFVAFKELYELDNGPGSFAAIAAVPEPSTALLFLLAACGLVLVARQRQANTRLAVQPALSDTSAKIHHDLVFRS